MPQYDWDEFQAAVKLLKAGISSIPFRDVIFAATGHKILPFDSKTLDIVRRIDQWLRRTLPELSTWVENEYRGRPNELGNAVEEWIRPRLNSISGIKCDRPKTARGVALASGYPDCVIESEDTFLYFDVKVYQSKTKNTTLRSFYYQPTNQSKIHHDAPHFLIGIEVRSRADNQPPFKIVDYTIVDILELAVKFKAEFNADNATLYSLRSLRARD